MTQRNIGMGESWKMTFSGFPSFSCFSISFQRRQTMAQTPDKNNAVITKELDGSFYPNAQMEIPRDVILREPFYVKGGVYAQNIRNNGTGTVVGPVMAGREITLTTPTAPNQKPLRFLSGLNATHSILIQEKNFPLEKTVINDIKQAGLIVRGDVVSDTVRLENTLILGSVQARQAFLKNSVIVGSVLAEEELRLTNSTFVSFSAGKATLVGQNACWLPFGISGEPIQFDKAESGNGNSTQAELRYLGICRTDTFGCGFAEGSICCEKFTAGACEYPNVRLGVSDVHPHTTEAGTKCYALTLARRALNLEQISDELQRVQEFLKTLLLYEHLDDFSKRLVINQWKEHYLPDELAILTIGTRID
jgi:hypothetical protein